MRLIKLSVNNLFSLGQINLDLNNRGLVLIHGVNGSGKSSLVNKSLTWILFGETAGGLKADDVINLYATGASSGSITFLDSSGVEFRVSRFRNPNQLKLENVKTGENLSRRDQKDTQELINRTLGRTLDTFLETDFFGQGKSRSFFELQPAQQVEVLESILPIEQLNQYVQNAKDQVSDTKNKLNKNELESSELKGRVAEINRQIIKLQSDISKWNLDRDIKEHKLVNKINVINVNKLSSEIENLKEQVLKVELSSTDFNDTLQSLREAQQTEKEWQAELNRRKKSTGTCPTCSQSIPCVDIKLVEDAETNLQHARDAVVFWTEDRQAWLNLEGLNREVQFKEQQLQSAETLQEELSALLNEKNPFELSSIDHTNTLKELEQSLEENNQTANKLTEQKSMLDFWVSTLGKDFKNFMINKACPYLNDRSNYYLTKLNNQKLSIEFATVSELASGDKRHKFNVIAKSKEGGAHYDSLSGAEQQLVNFATGLALADLASSQIGGTSNLMILDEPFTFMDQINASNLVNFIIDELLKKKETIFLISNDDLLKDQITNKVHVVKTNGLTEIT